MGCRRHCVPRKKRLWDEGLNQSGSESVRGLCRDFCNHTLFCTWYEESWHQMQLKYFQFSHLDLVFIFFSTTLLIYDVVSPFQSLSMFGPWVPKLRYHSVKLHFPIFHHTCCNIRHKRKLSIQPNHVGIKMDGNARRSTVGARHSKRTPSSDKTWKTMKTTIPVTHWRPDVRIVVCYAGLTRCGSRR